MQIQTLFKSKKFQLGVMMVLVAAVILFSLLTDFPEGDTQGALRNKRFAPVIQPQPIQSQPIQTPQNIPLTPITPNLEPITNNIDLPGGGF